MRRPRRDTRPEQRTLCSHIPAQLPLLGGAGGQSVFREGRAGAQGYGEEEENREKLLSREPGHSRSHWPPRLDVALRAAGPAGRGVLPLRHHFLHWRLNLWAT